MLKLLSRFMTTDNGTVLKISRPCIETHPSLPKSAINEGNQLVQYDKGKHSSVQGVQATHAGAFISHNNKRTEALEKKQKAVQFRELLVEEYAKNSHSAAIDAQLLTELKKQGKAHFIDTTNALKNPTIPSENIVSSNENQPASVQVQNQHTRSPMVVDLESEEQAKNLASSHVKNLETTTLMVVENGREEEEQFLAPNGCTTLLPNGHFTAKDDVQCPTLNQFAPASNTDLTEPTKANQKDFRLYARLLVDVDLQFNLPSRVLVERDGFSFEVNVTYEQLPDFCTHCSSLGHFVGDCRVIKRMQEESNRANDSKTKQQQKRKPQPPFKSISNNHPQNVNASIEIHSTEETTNPCAKKNLTSVETRTSTLFNAIPPPQNIFNAPTSQFTHPQSYAPTSNENVGNACQLSESIMEPTLGCNAYTISSPLHDNTPSIHPQPNPSSGSPKSSSTNFVESIGDEKEEPPIQSFVHSAEENLGLSDPQLCIELGEDLDTSVLNQDTPDNLKGTGYLSSLYSDSSPSISKTLYSPSESDYQPSSPLNTSPSTSSSPFTPSVPLIVTTTNKAKKRQAKKEQAEKEAMLRAGISQSSIDFCFRKDINETQALMVNGVDLTLAATYPGPCRETPLSDRHTLRSVGGPRDAAYPTLSRYFLGATRVRIRTSEDHELLQSSVDDL
ncbi:hypothetical protein LguiA_016909 [Lonicera macranthoides]